MKTIGIAFSTRPNGNTIHTVDFVLNTLANSAFETERCCFSDMAYTPCGSCNYYCFKGSGCIHNDDITALYEKCTEADLIIAAIPTYHGHLLSSYFAFSERAQGFFKGRDMGTLFLEKLHFIIIGNPSDGATDALQEALRNTQNRGFTSEYVVLSSVEAGISAIRDVMTDSALIQNGLLDFTKRILVKTYAL